VADTPLSTLPPPPVTSRCPLWRSLHQQEQEGGTQGGLHSEWPFPRHAAALLWQHG